jgi:TRAP-type C4-dicarboxylate transport system substrate-binding protein
VKPRNTMKDCEIGAYTDPADKKMKNRLMLMCVVLSALWNAEIRAQTLPTMRISVENAPSHVQTRAVQAFAEDIRQQLASRIAVEFFADARLFRDSDVISALMQGKVEMAVPGTWHVERFEPNVGIFLLPLFYGRPVQTNYAVLEGKIGQAITTRVEQNLHVKVLGRWIDLGHAHLFSVRQPIARHEDIRQKRVRVAGGRANELRIQAFGGIPTSIPWPDLPAYLEQGKIDAILTSYETVCSAKLWEQGIRYVFEDREYFPQYIPMIRSSFWDKLPADIRRILLDTWEKHVDPERQAAATAQAEAKALLRAQGVAIIIPDEQAITRWRQLLLPFQNDFIHTLKIDEELVKQLLDEFPDEKP